MLVSLNLAVRGAETGRVLGRLLVAFIRPMKTLFTGFAVEPASAEEPFTLEFVMFLLGETF
jgi:hypothetical protein